MYKRRILSILAFSFLICHAANAQEFGGNPSSTKWKQINNDTVRVIFPEGLDSEAMRVATITTDLQRNYNGTIGNKIKKINIVFQKDVTFSNAYVALGPYRSEYFLMPPQNAFELGAQSWTDNLAIHEFRHVQQYSNFNVGLSKAFSVLFGQYGQSLANAAAVPDWFFEGDAVYNETFLSEQGRGRLPLFLNSYKSLYFDNKHYNYMQMRNGSLQHYIPGHYELGYLLVAYGREKYGEDFWKNVTHDAAAYRPLFYPMQSAVQKYAGINYSQFVHNAFMFYQNKWDNEKENTEPEWLTGIKKNDVVSYQYPYATEDGSIIALKTTNSKVAAFFKINADKSETKIATRDIAYDDYFSYNNGKIIYTSLQPDVRWGNREYSIIKILDAKTGEVKNISSKSKYFTPDISHDGKTIAAVDYTPGSISMLVLLDADGKEIKSLNDETGHLFSYPKFSAHDNNIFMIDRNAAGEMAILKIKTDDLSKEIIVPYSNKILGYPTIKGDTVFYSCSNNGQDEIFAYVNKEKKNYRVATYQTGLYQATANSNGDIIASAFTSNGYRLAKVQPLWQQASANSLQVLYVAKPVNKEANDLLENIRSKDFAVTKYPKLYHPFNFHSWIPSYSYPDYSFSIYGENVLNTVQSQLYYTYNSNEKFHEVGFLSTYGGWYVQPFINVQETFNRTAAISADTTVNWNEFNAAAGLQLPLNLTGGKEYRFLTLTTSYNINNIQWRSDTKQLLNDINYINASLQYSSQVQKAPKQIFPHWAESWLLQYRASTTNITAHQLLATATFYLPGIFNSNNLVLNAAYQSRDTARLYAYTNNFPYSRGYDAINYPRMWKLGINYHFPLCYPDWGFANMIYFTRIRANLFYDYTNLKSLRTGLQYQLRSFGTEIYFDTKWWNQQPLQFGIRYSRLVDYKLVGLQPNQWSIILPVTLIN